MRRIVVSLFMALDGVIEGPGPGDLEFDARGWTMPYWADEIGAYIGASMANSDAMLLGRKTYDTFKRTFEGQTDPGSMGMNNARKYVVSTTLKAADWNNSTLIQGDIPAEIARLKQQPGKDISISGSATLVHTLMQHKLVDEYALLVYPVVIGHGARLFPDGIPQASFTLVEARPITNAVVLMRYQPT
jgi:dihydrofolate reductase